MGPVGRAGFTQREPVAGCLDGSIPTAHSQLRLHALDKVKSRFRTELSALSGQPSARSSSDAQAPRPLSAISRVARCLSAMLVRHEHDLGVSVLRRDGAIKVLVPGLTPQPRSSGSAPVRFGSLWKLAPQA
jgi:hypothetical protein